MDDLRGSLDPKPDASESEPDAFESEPDGDLMARLAESAEAMKRDGAHHERAGRLVRADLAGFFLFFFVCLSRCLERSLLVFLVLLSVPWAAVLSMWGRSFSLKWAAFFPRAGRV